MATVNLSDYRPLKINNASSFRIGIVVSEWNDFVTYNLRDGAIEVLKKEGIPI
ncbi:6,7-dimethyl-8-ribityllumazine synthase, partial [Kaistella carnis]